MGFLNVLETIKTAISLATGIVRVNGNETISPERLTMNDISFCNNLVI
jgi:hypothetical protein